ncbi:hypothetical protein OSB04_un001575 [Centaurea solstitialis]|uniref:Uncharacterized protein n=1 Tax=Centaurea solstitialis TaxID=347529 RepID=A0AA38SLK1_9ASTR|nr:hypothetical protein OSB04_un001575 [Centaurea solstitialis]
MSDRAASINAAITAIFFPNAHHALCCRHLVMNVRSRAPRIKQYKTPYWKACKAYTTRVFDRMMNILQVAVPEESMSRNARKLPIVGLMEYFREFQQEWYFIRRRKGDELNHQLTEWAQLKIQKRIVKSATWTAHGIGYDRWEVSGLPCGHAIAVAKRLVEEMYLILITVPYYMTELYKATYHGSFAYNNSWQASINMAPYEALYTVENVEHQPVGMRLGNELSKYPSLPNYHRTSRDCEVENERGSVSTEKLRNKHRKHLEFKKG